jgi:hypothetical protein
MRATFIPSFFPKPSACTLVVSCKQLENGGGAGYEPTRTRACAAGFPIRAWSPKGAGHQRAGLAGGTAWSHIGVSNGAGALEVAV